MLYTVMNRPEMMMDRMMHDFCTLSPRPQHRSLMGFPVDVRKTDAGYILTAELPGVKLSDIAITVENDVLTIAADLNRVSREENDAYVLRESRSGHIERSFTLEGIDQNAITASAEDGLLTINLPKEAPTEGKGPRRIAINGGSVPALEAPAQ